MRGKAIHLQLSTSMSLRRGINGFWGFSWLVGFLLKKKPQQRKLRMKIKMEVNSILIFDYNIKVNSDFSFGLWQISFGRYSGLESRPDGNRRRPGRHSY